MKIFGLLRVKNEARWIERAIRSIRPVCERVLVFDDHSTDATAEIAAGLGAVVIASPYQGLDETRDKNHLLERAWLAGAQLDDYCLMIDGDEELVAGDIPALERAMDARHCCGSLHIVYLWDREDQVRVDRWYREYRRPSLFRLTARHLEFLRTSYGGGFHCSSVPRQLLYSITRIPVRLLHYGYLHREDRVRKYHWYNQVDPNNKLEDCYRHMVVGDLFPAESAFKHAGPLELQAL